MATAGVAHVYEVLGLKQPKIIYADSPMRGLDFDMEVRYGTAGKGIKDRILKLRDADSTIAGVLRMLVGGTAASWAMILVQFEDMDLEKIDRQMIL